MWRFCDFGPVCKYLSYVTIFSLRFYGHTRRYTVNYMLNFHIASNIHLPDFSGLDSFRK